MRIESGLGRDNRICGSIGLQVRLGRADPYFSNNFFLIDAICQSFMSFSAVIRLIDSHW